MYKIINNGLFEIKEEDFTDGYKLYKGFYIIAYDKMVFGKKVRMYKVEQYDTCLYKSSNLKECIKFCDDFNKCLLCIPATDELVELTNKIREQQGNTDLVSVDNDNNVYYDFYLCLDDKKTNQIKLQAVYNYGEKDAEVWYEIDLLPEEKEMLLFKIIKELVNELN